MAKLPQRITRRGRCSTAPQPHARASSPLRLVIAVLVGMLMLSTVAPTQAASDDLEPTITNLPVSAFHTSSELQLAEAGARILQTGMLTAPVPFTDLLLRWPALAPDAAPLQLAVRVSTDGTDWSKWGVVEPSEDLTDLDEEPATVWSDPIYAGESRFYQLRITLPPEAPGSLSLLGSVQVHTVNAELANLVTPPPMNEDTISASSISPPRYVSRTAWGNPHGESAPKAPPQYYPANHLVVHHTADSNTLSSGEPNWAARVRAIWSFHTYSRGWGDIGYNWLIDPNGVIYAGRAGSTDPNRDAVGFHDAGNYGSIGVALLGTYETVLPSTAAQDSLVNLLRWKASQRSIDPLGSSYYSGCARSKYCAPHNPGSVVPNIVSHWRVNGGRTACPGDRFMQILPSIRQRVAQRTVASATTTAAVNLRAGPSTAHTVLRVIPPGEYVPIHSGPHNGVWYEVTYLSTHGYVHGNYLRR